MKLTKFLNMLFNAFSPAEQVRALYICVWAQTIFNVIAILYPEMRVKFISASLILGIYTVLMIARP